MILQKLNFPRSGWKIFGCDTIRIFHAVGGESLGVMLSEFSTQCMVCEKSILKNPGYMV